jgi:hypothetical protein
MWSNKVTEIMADYWKKFDTIVMGGKTYELHCVWVWAAARIPA